LVDDFTAGFAATFAVGLAAGFGAGLGDGFGATFVTGFAAAFGATLVDATFAGAAFTGVPVVTLLTCFAFVTCSPPLPL
jgi:carbon starvation protein CstA